MTRRLPALLFLGVALCASRPADAATMPTGASLLLSERVAIGMSQNLVIGSVSFASTPTVSTISPVSPLAISPMSGSAVPVISSQMGNFTQRLAGDVSRGTVQQASFVIIGDSDRSVSISVPDTVALSRLGGNEQLEFDSETSLAAGDLGQSRLAVAPGGGGELSFDVGGRVQVADNTVAGDYAGILRVTVQYN